jgi:hypothetical protein
MDNWQLAPNYVLLVGDASYDPRDYQGFGDQDRVPTKLLGTLHMETASDDWFADFDSDRVPEMAVGRIPVQSASEAALVVTKIVGYEGSVQNDETLLVADENWGYDFEDMCQDLEPLLPENMAVREILRGQDPRARDNLLSRLNWGPMMVSYVGHGSVNTWRGGLFSGADAMALENDLQLPFFVNMTCLNGFFQAPYADSLAESLLKAEGGGALAVWASSGLTGAYPQHTMNRALIRHLFNGTRPTLGDATRAAKQAVSDMDVRKTWILFGDPTTRLK